MKRVHKTARAASRLIYVLMIGALAWGCEDVIDVDLDNVAPKLVIEGVLSNRDDYFVITRTTDFYNPNAVERVSGAIVVVSYDFGRVDTLSMPVSGEYVFDYPYVPVPGRTYRAAVTIDGVTYTASTTMPEPIEIDSLRTEYQDGGGVGTEEDEGYRVHVFFEDAANRPDYARIKLDTHLDFYLYDGRYSDGNTIDYEYFWSVFQLDEQVDVELYAMDKVMYNYFLTLNEVWASEDGGNFLDATPANPNTNWSGGALGYFGAFNVDRKFIVVTDSESTGESPENP